MANLTKQFNKLAIKNNKNKNKKNKPKQKSTNKQQMIPRRRNNNINPDRKSTLGRTLLNLAGTAAGGFFGGPTGAGIGGSVSNGIANILGMGSYSVKQNTILKGINDGQVPNMHKSDEGVTIRHREYLGDITTSGSANTFAQSQYSINAGEAGTFPFLAAIAANFQQYQFTGLVFDFQSTSADALNSTNTALGSVMMNIQYRVDNTVTYVNKQQLLNEMWAVDSKPSTSFCAPVECDPSLNVFPRYFVRTATVPSGEDIKTYDMGVMTIATTGFQGTSVNIGELWVTYECKLFKPQISSQLALTAQSAHYTFNTYTNAAPLTGHASVYDSIGMTLTNTVVTFPIGSQGYYGCTFVWHGTQGVCVLPSFTLVNCTGSDTFSHAVGDSTTNFYYYSVINITDFSKIATITIGGAGTLPATGTAGQLVIGQLNGNYIS